MVKFILFQHIIVINVKIINAAFIVTDTTHTGIWKMNKSIFYIHLFFILISNFMNKSFKIFDFCYKNKYKVSRRFVKVLLLIFKKPVCWE